MRSDSENCLKFTGVLQQFSKIDKHAVRLGAITRRTARSGALQRVQLAGSVFRSILRGFRSGGVKYSARSFALSYSLLPAFDDSRLSFVANKSFDSGERSLHTCDFGAISLRPDTVRVFFALFTGV